MMPLKAFRIQKSNFDDLITFGDIILKNDQKTAQCESPENYLESIRKALGLSCCCTHDNTNCSGQTQRAALLIVTSVVA